MAIEPGVPCGRCRVCRAGRYNLCPDMRFMATPPVNGAFARYVAVDVDFVHPIPDSITAEEAALVEPLSVGIWACQRAGVQPADRVLITGAGPVGLLAADAARAFGASTVTLRDIEQTRLAFARDRGFRTDDDVNGPGGRYDVLLECSGAAGALGAGLRTLDRAGRVVLVSVPKTVDVVLPLVELMDHEPTVSTIFRYANTWPLAISLVSSGRISVGDLVTHRFPLRETERALTASSTLPRVIKPVVLCQS